MKDLNYIKQFVMVFDPQLRHPFALRLIVESMEVQSNISTINANRPECLSIFT
jgi:hypothetical protein